MIIKAVPWSYEDTFVYQLPEPEMIVDPRPINLLKQHRNIDFKNKVRVEGAAIIVTGIGTELGLAERLSFRVYSRNEFHYSFESTKYLYHGIDGERAPENATTNYFQR